MKTTKTILENALAKIGVSIKDVEALYNWTPDVVEAGTPITSDFLYNNSKTWSDMFVDDDYQKPTVNSALGISMGTTKNPIDNNAGYGTFVGTDVVWVSKNQELDNWTILINFEYQGCPANTSKRRIIFYNKGTNANTGFKIGINGDKNLFYEYYDSTGLLKVHTVQQVLGEKNIIAVSHSKGTKTTKIFIYNPSNGSTTEKEIRFTEDLQKGDEWYLGGVSPISSLGSIDEMFVGGIYEFLLFSKTLSEDKIKLIFDTMLTTSSTGDQVVITQENYFKTLSHAVQQVQIGTEITGYSDQSVTITDEAGIPLTFHEETPIISPVYKDQAVYTQDTNPSQRDVQQIIEGVITYDDALTQEYFPTCLLLKNPDGSTTYDYQINNHKKYIKDLNNVGLFNTGDASFVLLEDYESSKTLYVYINGLLVELGTDYTRDGKNINKYSGEYTLDDVCVYDVVEGGASHFVDFDPANGDLEILEMAHHDVYLDGEKLTFGTDYEFFNPVGQLYSDLRILSSSVSAGRLAVISLHSEFRDSQSGSITTFKCFSGTSLASESVWLNKLRKINTDYLLNNDCDLANSNIVVSQKSTVIYENQPTYFNI